MTHDTPVKAKSLQYSRQLALCFQSTGYSRTKMQDEDHGQFKKGRIPAKTLGKKHSRPYERSKGHGEAD